MSTWWSVSSALQVTMPLPAASPDSTLAHSSSATFALMMRPPSNPISTRDSAMPVPFVRWLHEFHQHAVHAVRMDERHAQPEQPYTRLLVDQLGAGGGGIGQRPLDVVDPQRHVVHAGAAVLQELADRGVVTQRPQQLNASVTEQHRRRLHALVGHRLAVLEHTPQQLLVVGDGGVEVVDGMPDMMDRLCAHCARILVGHLRDTSGKRRMAWAFWTRSCSRRRTLR